MTPPTQTKTIIGWREWVSFPDWNLTLKAKIDTGARSSSLDVVDIQHLPGQRVRFNVHRLRKRDQLQTVEADIVRKTRVRSSSGHIQDRIVVRTTLSLAGVQKPILLTLTSRRKMLHRILLGREALQDDFLIDAGVDHLVTQKKSPPSRETIGRRAKRIRPEGRIQQE